MMRKMMQFGLMAGTLLMAGAALAKSVSQEIIWPADKIEYKAIMPGIEKVLLTGDDKTGSYMAMTKFKAGTNNALHTHRNDIRIAVISGSFNYKPEDGAEVKLGPGSFLVIPAGKKHASGADQDTHFVEQSNGKFSMDLVKKD